MSEQRFKIDMSANKQFCITDRKERKLTTSMDTVVDWLNSLNEENEQLKEENEQLQCNHKKAIIGFLKFMKMDNPLMEIMIDEFLEEVYDGELNE